VARSLRHPAPSGLPGSSKQRNALPMHSLVIAAWALKPLNLRPTPSPPRMVPPTGHQFIGQFPMTARMRSASITFGSPAPPLSRGSGDRCGQCPKERRAALAAWWRGRYRHRIAERVDKLHPGGGRVCGSPGTREPWASARAAPRATWVYHVLHPILYPRYISDIRPRACHVPREPDPIGSIARRRRTGPDLPTGGPSSPNPPICLFLGTSGVRSWMVRNRTQSNFFLQVVRNATFSTYGKPMAFQRADFQNRGSLRAQCIPRPTAVVAGHLANPPPLRPGSLRRGPRQLAQGRGREAPRHPALRHSGGHSVALLPIHRQVSVALRWSGPFCFEFSGAILPVGLCLPFVAPCPRHHRDDHHGGRGRPPVGPGFPSLPPSYALPPPLPPACRGTGRDVHGPPGAGPPHGGDRGGGRRAPRGPRGAVPGAQPPPPLGPVPVDLRELARPRGSLCPHQGRPRAQLLGSLPSSVQHVILFGDHKQLPPGGPGEPVEPPAHVFM